MPDSKTRLSTTVIFYSSTTSDFNHARVLFPTVRLAISQKLRSELKQNMSIKMTINETRAPCALCYEDFPKSSMCRLSQCGHESCLECFTRWIATEEASGTISLPVCPFCRLKISDQDVLTILDRPYHPCEASATGPEVEMDDLTRQWLEEETRQCGNCGARIAKVPGGCNMMECLCGYRFCYSCGSQGAQCSCSPSNHYFWDNILDDFSRTAPECATADVATGSVELKDHMVKRQRQQRQHEMQCERSYERARRLLEEQQIEALFLSAPWLFCRRVQTSYRVLDQQAQTIRVRIVRIRRTQLNEIDASKIGDYFWSATWLFCKDSRNGFRVLNYQCQRPIPNPRVQRRQQAAREAELVNCHTGLDTKNYIASMRALFGNWPAEKQVVGNIRLVGK